MQTRLKTTIDNSEIGFRRFIKYQRSLIDRKLKSFETFDKYFDDEWDEYIEALKFKKLDNEFIGTLNYDELKIIKYIQYHNPNENTPSDFYKNFNSAFVKWSEIFFEPYDLTFCDINSYRLGRLMKTIRTSHNLKMAELARAFDIDVSCVSLYESGQRLPNLNYIKKFAYLFSISIDDLVNNSLEDNLYSSLTCNIQNK